MKNYQEWMGVKADIHNAGRILSVNEGDVWWCSIGENVGVEIDGKDKFFLRPILVMKKLSRYGFMGIPLTSQEHNGSWYVGFNFKDKHQNAVLSQARTISVYRLRRKMGTVPSSDLELIRNGFRKLYF